MNNPAQRRTVHPFADQGKFTAVHNSVFDVIMPDLPPNAFKVLCFIIRKTVGWQKESDQLAYSQIAKGTGIKSPATLSTAIDVLIKRKYIISASDGKWEATSYRLNTALEIEVPSTTEIEVENATTEIEATSKTVAATTSKIVVEPTSNFEDTKESIKQKKERGGDTRPRTLSELALTIADVCKINPRIATSKQRERLNVVYQFLNSIEATPPDVRAREAWWYANDWRARKENRPPKPEELQEIWEYVKTPAKKHAGDRQVTDLPLIQSSGGPTPEERRAAAERRKAMLNERATGK